MIPRYRWRKLVLWALKRADIFDIDNEIWARGYRMERRPEPPPLVVKMWGPDEFSKSVHRARFEIGKKS
jgi:hypothetical protein